MKLLGHRLVTLCLLALAYFSASECSHNNTARKAEQVHEFLGIPTEELNKLFLNVSTREAQPTTVELLGQEITAMQHQMGELHRTKMQAEKEGKPFPLNDKDRAQLRANMNALLSHAAQSLWQDGKTAEQLMKASDNDASKRN